jgi:hypothetical protein
MTVIIESLSLQWVDLDYAALTDISAIQVAKSLPEFLFLSSLRRRLLLLFARSNALTIREIRVI